MISAETWALRQEVLRKYGGHCRCPCGCRESNLRRLQLHHVHGGGRQERQSIRGHVHYARLVKRPVTPDLEPLCVGCHWEETMFGACQGGDHRETVNTSDEIAQADTAGDGKLSKPGHKLGETPFDYREPVAVPTPAPVPLAIPAKRKRLWMF